MNRSSPIDFFENSKKAFQKHFPSVWGLLKTIEHSDLKPLLEDGRTVNLEIGDNPFYPRPGKEWAEMQLDAYFNDPDRIVFNTPDHCNIALIMEPLGTALVDCLKERNLTSLEGAPVSEVGFFFVFGVGLGFHVPELVKRNVTMNLVLIEPVLELLLHSLSAIDWRRLMEEAAAKKVSLYIIAGKSPEETMEALHSIIHKKGPLFIDGSYAFIHYASPTIEETRILMNDQIRLHFKSLGFFEDELLMTRNTYLNALRYPLHLLGACSGETAEMDIPVLIIGSGPSLDNDLEEIKRLSDRALLVTCGSAIGVLLKNGVRPDIHVENENNNQLVQNLKRARKIHDFDGITLICPTTVDPSLFGMFAKHWFYLRERYCSSNALFGEGIASLKGSSPIVGNVALASMLMLGFREIYFFGVDCGQREGLGHHSKDSVYFEDDYELEEDLEVLNSWRENAVPANFGGEVMTSQLWERSLNAMAPLIKEYPARVFNCSNGAKIEGAAPLRARQVKIDKTVENKAAALKSIEKNLRYFPCGQFLDSQQGFAGHAAACEDFSREIIALFEQAKAEDSSYRQLDERLRAFIEKSKPRYEGVLSICETTIVNIVRLGAFFGTRIADETSRHDFFLFFLDEFRAVCLQMISETKVLFDEITERRPELSVIPWTEIEYGIGTSVNAETME